MQYPRILLYDFLKKICFLLLFLLYFNELEMLQCRNNVLFINYVLSWEVFHTIRVTKCCLLLVHSFLAAPAGDNYLQGAQHNLETWVYHSHDNSENPAFVCQGKAAILEIFGDLPRDAVCRMYIEHLVWYKSPLDILQICHLLHNARHRRFQVSCSNAHLESQAYRSFLWKGKCL